MYKKKLVCLTLMMFLLFFITALPASGKTLLSAVAATGDGSAVFMNYVAKTWTCHVTVTGTAPTSVTVKMKGSMDGVVFSSYTTATYTIATPDTRTFHTYRKPAWHLMGNYDSKIGGDGTTRVTLFCGGVL